MRSESLFNFGWEFIKMPFGSAADEACAADTWKRVDLPHDWLIYDSKDLYGDASGFYRKTFILHKDPEMRYILNFDGVYMDSVLYVNGNKVTANPYGYSSFDADITDFAVNGLNTALVEIRHKSPNSRWYSGAGIFRDVTFREVPAALHIAGNGVYISCSRLSDRQWEVTADTELEGRGISLVGEKAPYELPEGFSIEHSIDLLPTASDDAEHIFRLCPESRGFVVADSSSGDNCSVCRHPCSMRTEVRISDVSDEGRRCIFHIDNPFVWDITSPNRYLLTTELKYNGETVDRVSDIFGLREFSFTPDRGFILNGRRVKLNGCCEHHDLGCIGSAFNRDAMRRKFVILKKMGINAIRTSHNMPSKQLMELADEMGILIDSEAFDMWRRAKTEFDYARFFEENYKKDVESWVRRDRNHPSLIMWSVGNEIYDCHADESAVALTASLRDQVRKHDYRHNAPVTFGSNFMPWEGAQNCAKELEVVGYNYAERIYDEHHAKYPDWCIYGSETSSTVQSRGIYHFPMKVSVMADDDDQCSTLGNCTTSWGAKNSEYVILEDRDRPFSAGTFIWTGFDYIGEPTPYHTKNSYFGMVDTAGFPKDTYYIFKSAWTDPDQEPFVHLFPYWDFNEGQLIDVRIASNCPEVELIVNGRSLGRRQLDQEKGSELAPVWQVAYEPGYIEAVAYNKFGRPAARERRSSCSDPARVLIREFEHTGHKYRANGKDLIFLEISALDKDGNPVDNAVSRMKVEVEGAGFLAGLDNGDSTDFEQYKCNSRRLFSGKLLAVVCTGYRPGPVTVKVSSPGLESAVFTADVIYDNETSELGKAAFFEDQGHLSDADRALECRDMGSAFDNDIPVRKLEIMAEGSRTLSPDRPSVSVNVKIHPADAVCSDIIWKPVNDSAVESNLARISGEGQKVTLTGMGDGDFRLRCMTHNGTDKLKTISVLEFKGEGLGQAYLDPYSFIAGSLYTDHEGDVGNGNEKGVATARTENSYVGFENIDFGDFGSDEITIPIFTLDGKEYVFGIWEGRPQDPSSRLLLEAHYQKPSIWNVYQPETYKLNYRVKGISSIYFTAKEKFHIKGFSFTRLNKAFETVAAIENDRIYGDTFTVGKEEITGIGNNVTLEFENMNFASDHSHKLVICGKAAKNNSIHLKAYRTEGCSTTLLEFKACEGYTEESFEIPDMTEATKIAFVFLPGSDFDMKYFRFVRDE